MNNQLLNLATAIQSKIQQLKADSFSEIDKDVLLEDLRNLYRLAQKIEISPKEDVEKAPNKTNATIENTEIPTQFTSTFMESKPAEAEKEKFNFNVEMKEDTSPSTELNEVPLEDLIASIRQELHAEKQQEEVEKEKNLQLDEPNTTDNLHLTQTTNEQKSPLVHTKDQPAGIGGNMAPSLNEVFVREEISLNERASSSPVKELHNFISSKTSISSMLDFNSRILLSKELFSGNTESCNTFIAQLERCGSLDEAKSLVNTNALSKGWKAENEAVKMLVHVVRKVFA